MRICVSGTGSQGKSTFINDFLERWSSYTSPKDTYRKFVKDNHSKNGTKDMQWKILNNMVDELQKHDSNEKIIYDRGPLDNLAYTIYLHSHGLGGVDTEFVEKSMAVAKESFKFIDIIFYIPITKATEDITYDNDKFLADKANGITDESYRLEIDNIFKALKYDWDVNQASNIFDPHDKPGLIEIFGTPSERLHMTGLYLNADGELIGGEGDISSILSEAELMEQQSLKREMGIVDEITDEIVQNPKGYQ